LINLISNGKSVTNVINYFKQYAKDLSIDNNSSHDNLTAVLIQTNRSSKGFLKFSYINSKSILITAFSLLTILLLLSIFVYPDPLKLNQMQTIEKNNSLLTQEPIAVKESVETLQKAFNESIKLHEEIIASKNRQLNPKLIERIKDFLMRYKDFNYTKK